jgi:hypothetical protein
MNKEEPKLDIYQQQFKPLELQKLKAYLISKINSKVNYHMYSDNDVEIVTRCIDALTKLE